MRKKPPALKKAQGTFRKDRDNPNAPEFELFEEVPKPPTYFDERSREIWQRIAGELVRIKMLSKVDVDLLASYVTALRIVERTHQELNKKGGLIQAPKRSRQSPSASFQVFCQSVTIINQLGSRFGFNPVDRTKIIIHSDKAVNPDEDALMQLTQGGSKKSA